jgi:hypothetical protein
MTPTLTAEGRNIPFAARIAWARAWRIRNKPHFDALYGAETPGVAVYPRAILTEPRRWREANKARFDAMYGEIA